MECQIIKRFAVGDRVQIDIPDPADPDFDQYHGRVGEVVEVLEDDAGEQAGGERDAYLFSVEFSDGDQGQFRWCDLRPASGD